MNLETRVGLFILLGLGVLGGGIMKLSDISLKKSYTLYFVFDDVGNLRDKSRVKMSGVEVGKVSGIRIENGRAKVSARIHADIPVYADGGIKIRLSGLIGTQFLDLIPGTREAPRLKDGDTLMGQPTRTLDQLIEKISELVEGKDGKGGAASDLKATLANLRSITDSLNSAIGKQRDELKDMVSNFHQFSKDLKGITSDFHEVTSARKGDMDVSIARLKSILERVDEIVAKIQKGEGSIGKFVTDKEMGEEVKETMTHIKETAQSAREVLARFTKVRSFWEFELRSIPAADGARFDGGIRLQPRENKYYYLGVSNAGDRKHEFRDAGDYEKKNTLTALFGKEYGFLTVELGAIRSSAGVGLKVYPFKTHWIRNLELEARAFDFGRDEVRGRTGQERAFKNPQYNLGAHYRLNRFIALGASIEDLAEIKQYNLKTHLTFEDKDLAYLFGFVSFAR